MTRTGRPPMELVLGTFRVREVRFGTRTVLEGGVLTVQKAELERLLSDDPALQRVEVNLALPGERTRIIHALDVVEPRVKVEGKTSIFPGFLGLPRTVGTGRTLRLDGVAVVEASPLAWAEDGISVKEAIIDMSGPAVDYCPFAKTCNVVLSFDLLAGLNFRIIDAAIRRAGLRTAAYLAEVARGLRPDEEAVMRFDPVSKDLPRLAYVDSLMTEGAVHNTFVYGAVVDGLPTLLHPNELQDGAIVNGNHHIACERNPTYFQQRNPIAERLAARHGVEADFVGVIAAKTQHVSLPDKERVASHTAQLAHLLGVDGVVISHDTAGHAAINLMLTCQRCEEAGIRTVIVVNELCGPEGTDWGLVHVVPEAVAMVSTGNKDEFLDLPAMDRVLGGERIIDWQGYEDRVDVHPGEAFRTPLRRIYCAATQVGAGRLTAAAY